MVRNLNVQGFHLLGHPKRDLCGLVDGEELGTTEGDALGLTEGVELE